MEVLVVVAVIGVLAGLSISAMSGILKKGEDAKSIRQAHTIATTYAAARAAGASFAVQSRAGIVDSLTQPGGVQGRGIFADVVFSVPMSGVEKNLLKQSPSLVEGTLPDGSFFLEFHPEG